MNATEARQLWIKALRSGEYKQTQGILCDCEEGSYCCLGVACEVYNQNVGSLAIGINLNSRTYNGSDITLPDEVAEWLDITYAGDLVGTMVIDSMPDDSATDLAEVNDGLEFSFEEIADVIETCEFKPYAVGVYAT